MPYRFFRCLIPLLLAVLVSWSGPGAAKSESAARPGPLVDAAWLHAHKDAPDLAVIDLRNAIDGGSPETYRAGHIPGAVYSNYLGAGWRVTRDGVPGMLPPVADLERLIGGLGIDNDDHVVLVAGGVGATDMGSATRVYWTFKVLGHDTVSILDGGHRAYAAAYDLETGAVTPEPAAFEADFRPGLIAARETVRQRRADGAATLIDNRPHLQFRGRQKPPPVSRFGTIPTARSLPEGDLVAPDGTFRRGAALDALLADAGLAGTQPAVTFCNTGHWASLGWFALHELRGQDDVRLYDGSMSEWTHAGEPVVVHFAAEAETDTEQ